MTISFHFNADDANIQKKGTFIKALEAVVTELVGEDSDAISIDVDGPEDNADPENEEDANFVNITLTECNNNDALDRFQDIFKIIISVLRKPDGSFPYKP